MICGDAKCVLFPNPQTINLTSAEMKTHQLCHGTATFRFTWGVCTFIETRTIMPKYLLHCEKWCNVSGWYTLILWNNGQHNHNNFTCWCYDTITYIPCELRYIYIFVPGRHSDNIQGIVVTKALLLNFFINDDFDFVQVKIWSLNHARIPRMSNMGKIMNRQYVFW